MKAIVLWQPWATAMALNRKRNETRGRRTHFRGDLAICSAKRTPTKALYPDIERDMFRVVSIGDVHPAPTIYDEPVLKTDKPYTVATPLGFVLCVVEVFGCLPTDDLVPGKVLELGGGQVVALTDQERELGDYRPGRYAWLTRGCRRLREPVPVTGRQGLFNLPADVEALVRRQM